MGTSDTVPAILSPYSKEFRVWGCDGKAYKQHDLVPSVGMASTYAVLLDATETTAHRRFLTVQQNRITNLMAHQAIDGAAVFDVRGKYLGRGGGELDVTPQVSLEKAVSMVEAATRRAPPVSREILAETTEPTATFLEPPPEEGHVRCRLHRFWLREDLEIQIKLPLDLTDEEAERVAVFVTTLPLGAKRDG